MTTMITMTTMTTPPSTFLCFSQCQLVFHDMSEGCLEKGGEKSGNVWFWHGGSLFVGGGAGHS